MKIEIFATNWIFTLFTSTIPLDVIVYFFDCFFNESWVFFYKLVVHLLIWKKDKIMSINELSDMIETIKIKPQKETINDITDWGMKILSSVPIIGKFLSHESINWVKVIKESMNEKYIDIYIAKLYSGDFIN